MTPTDRLPSVVTANDDYEEEEEEPCICGNPFGDAKKTGAVLVYDPTPKDEEPKKQHPLTQWFQKIIKRNDNKNVVLQKQASLRINSSDDDDKITDDDDDSLGILRVPDASSCPVLLTPELFLELSKALPWSLRHSTWERCFCIARDGDSIQHMLRLCQPYNQTLLVLQTTQGQVLGAFCTGKWQLFSKKNNKNNNKYYGTGQSFLFNVNQKQSCNIYKWTGTNEYCQLCSLESGRIAMGGGNGDFGLVLEDNFSIGHSGQCATYANPPLAGDNSVKFEIAALELYGPKSSYLF